MSIYLNQTNQVDTQSFLTFNKAYDPLFGTFSPSIQPRISQPICDGLAHLLKSLFGIAYLFVYVSIVSGRIVTTFCYLPYFIKYQVKFNARECTPVLAIEYAIIYGWGYLNTAAAPVSTTKPFQFRYLVAKCAASKLGLRLTSNIFWHLLKQSQSLMLPPTQPPAVTTIESNLVFRFFNYCKTFLLLSPGDVDELNNIFDLEFLHYEKSTLVTLQGCKLFITCLPNCPLPPMHKIFLVAIRISNIISQQLLQCQLKIMIFLQ